MIKNTFETITDQDVREYHDELKDRISLPDIKDAFIVLKLSQYFGWASFDACWLERGEIDETLKDLKKTKSKKHPSYILQGGCAGIQTSARIIANSKSNEELIDNVIGCWAQQTRLWLSEFKQEELWTLNSKLVNALNLNGSWHHRTVHTTPLEFPWTIDKDLLSRKDIMNIMVNNIHETFEKEIPLRWEY